MDPIVCCLLGVCCPPAAQEAAWARLFTEECAVPHGDATRIAKMVCLKLAPVFKVLHGMAAVLGVTPSA